VQRFVEQASLLAVSDGASRRASSPDKRKAVSRQPPKGFFKILPTDQWVRGMLLSRGLGSGFISFRERAMKNRRHRAVFLIASAACALLGSAASGGVLAPADEVPEMMMQAQGSYAIFLATQYGTPPKILSYVSSTDIAGRSFSFALAAGSTYNGQSATLNASGAFNSITGNWDFSAGGTVGAGNWSSSGVGIDPAGDWMFRMDFPSTYLVVSDVTYTQTATRTVSQGTFTVKDFTTGAVVSTSQHTDTLILQGPGAGNWMWDDGLFHTIQGDRRVDASGFTPIEGGIGSFTAAITVPEPGCILWLLVVSSGAGRLCRRKRRIFISSR
jgi:hypothetical protein